MSQPPSPSLMNCVQNRADFARHPDIAGRSDTEATAVRRPVDRRDHRLTQPVDPGGQVGDAFLPSHTRPRKLQARTRIRRFRIGQVETRAEASPGTGEHDDPAVRTSRDLVDGAVQRLHQIGGQRIELLGPVQGNDRDLGSRVVTDPGVAYATRYYVDGQAMSTYTVDPGCTAVTEHSESNLFTAPLTATV